MLTQGFWKFYGSITEAPETIFQKCGGASRPVASSLSNPTSKMFRKGLYSNCYLHPYLDKFTPHFCVFGCFLSKMLQNFTDYITTPIFFLECCETWRIAQQCFFSTSKMSQNFMDYLTMGFKYLETVKRRLHATKQWFPDEIRVWHLGPSSPRPVFGCPGLPNNFKDKGLACLGEHIASRLSFSSPGWPATAPRWPFAYK